MSRTTEVAISCLCTRHRHTYTLDLPVPPLRYSACHCDSCRHLSGALFNTALPWQYTLIASSTEPSGTSSKSDATRDLTKYDFGPRLNTWFCGTCSTKMYSRYKKPGSSLEIFPALLPVDWLQRCNVDLKCDKQLHLLDTVDGGLARCFVDDDAGHTATTYAGETDSEAILLSDARLQRHEDAVHADRVEAHCHCRGTVFRLRKADGQKWTVRLDGSPAAVLFSSNELSAWADVPWSDLDFATAPSIEGALDLKNRVKQDLLGTLTVFEDKAATSDRYFCRQCSASIFSVSRTSDNTDQPSCQIAVGLLESTSGARAEDVLSWPSEPVKLAHRGIEHTSPV